MIVFHSCKRFN